MPIRFRCVYCSQLLAIARRKAGKVVKCTHCQGQIMVPEEEPVAVARSGGESRAILEQGDIDALLRPLEDTSPRPAAYESSDVHVPLPAASPWKWPAMVMGAATLFALGFLAGRMTAG